MTATFPHGILCAGFCPSQAALAYALYSSLHVSICESTLDTIQSVKWAYDAREGKWGRAPGGKVKAAGTGVRNRLPLTMTERKKNSSRSPIMLTYLCYRSPIRA